MLVFNGEIYNYLELREELAAGHGATFHTDGDGEAIIAAYHYWGTDALTRLRGMFAFALWDTVERELFCARDPFGIKPLFMATGSAGTAVGSEKKCLLDLADELGIDLGIDERAVQHYTVLQYVPEPETLHRGVRRLESGSYARVRPGAMPEVTRYFTPRFAAVPFSRAAASRAATTRSPRCWRTRSPSTCAPMSPSAPSCPAVSTPPRSPRWRCGTTRG